mgnify:CR=1 FL=1
MNISASSLRPRTCSLFAYFSKMSRILSMWICAVGNLRSTSCVQPRSALRTRHQIKRTHLHHDLKLLVVDTPVLVQIAPVYNLKQVIHKPRLDRRAVSERVDGPQRSSQDAKVRVDFERELVVLVLQERGDARGEGVHSCEGR